MADVRTILQESAGKLENAIRLVRASTRRVTIFDETREYEPEELEPYDALVGRFERAVEVALNKFFRAVELSEGETPSETIRDRLNRMAKIGLVSDVELWLRMRDVRNRISHDYLPGHVKQIYEDILVTFAPELARLSDRLKGFLEKAGQS